MKRPSDDDIIDLLGSHDGFIFDLDGTIWAGTTLIEGAAELLALLRELEKKVFFVTNNATKSRKEVVQKLAKLGVQASQEEIYTSAFAAATYLKGKGFSRKVYVVGEEGIMEELQLQGISATGGPQHRGVEVDWSEGDPYVQVDPEVGCVVAGLDRYVSYYKLQYATLCLLQNKDCSFIATNVDSRGNLSSKQEWIGAGTMVCALVGASEREPTIMGKPSSYMLEHICQATGITKDKLCIIGDRLDTDIAWGINNKTGATVLVLSGVTNEEQLLAADNTVHPTFYVDSVASLLKVKQMIEAHEAESQPAQSSCVIS